jgi:hypothetical protein
MLNFVKTVFHNLFEVFLWVNLILCTIIGGIIGNGIGRYTFSFDRHPVLGGIIGLICGMLINIVGGGVIATILNIDENLEQVMYKMNTPNNSSTQSNSNSNLPPISAPITGDTWGCKKCGERNRITSTSCKSCGAYR